MEILYGIILIFFGISLLGVSFLWINSLCNNFPVCNIDEATMLFIIILIISGLIVLVLGIKKVTRDYLTNKKGIEKYGLVIDSVKRTTNGNGVTDTHYYVLTILIVENSGFVNKYKEVNVSNYDIGSYVRVKHYKKDINIINSVSYDLVPEDIRYKLEEYNNKKI